MQERIDTHRRALRALLAALLMAVAGCGGGGSDPPPAAEPAPAASIPEGLRGQWEAVFAYVPPFYAGPYGDIPPGDGALGVRFTFWPDGRYQHTWNMTQAYFGGLCFRSAGWTESGTVSGTGPDFVFNPTHASYSAMDSCGVAEYLDPAPVTAATHSMVTDQDAAGWPLLRMGYPDWELVLEKCRTCD